MTCDCNCELDKDNIINHHADAVSYIKGEKQALWAIIRELCPDDIKRKELIEKYFIKFGI